MKRSFWPAIAGAALAGTALLYMLQSASAAVVTDTPMAMSASGTTTIMVMKHLCQPTIRSEADFQAVEAKGNGNPVAALAQTVLACPTIRNVGNDPAPGSIAGVNQPYQFELIDKNGVIHHWNEGVFKQHKLCESDIGLDLNADGQTSSGTCLDISHYEFSVPTGPVTVIEKTPPANTQLGTLRFTPTQLASNNDHDSLVATYPGNGVIALNTMPDSDHRVMMHIYDFQQGAQGSGISSSSAMNASMSSMHSSFGSMSSMAHANSSTSTTSPMGSTSSMSSMQSAQGQYYPFGGPSNYYAVPGQMLGFFGRNFANERVDLYDTHNQLVTTFVADGGGNFERGNVFMVPYADANSVEHFRFAGESSNTSVNFEVKVGQYYPLITPSSFYLMHGERFSVNATRFAPNEPVTLSVNGASVGHGTADGGGNLLFDSILAPSGGGSFTVQGAGDLSGNRSTMTVYLMQ
jgi:hypothetical protein